MTAEPAASRGGASRTVPIVALVIGGLILGYGLVILAPLVPTAAWSGVLDSASFSPGSGPGFPGRSAGPAVTLFFRGASSGRSFTLPGPTAVTAESLKSGDTVRVLVAWATLRETPAAVNLTSGASVLVDSAMVLRSQRTQRSRIGLLGAVILLFGLTGTLRSARKPSVMTGG
jgi:hypothetical protein